MRLSVHRGQLVTAAFLLMLVLLITWIAQNTYWREVDPPLRLRGPAAINPFYAADQLAVLLGAQTQWRHDTLQLPPSDGVILAADWSFALERGRLDPAVEDWVARGGRLVLDASLLAGRDELTRWAGIGRAPLPEEAQRRTRLRYEGAIAASAHDDPWGAPRHYQLCCLDFDMQLTTRSAPDWALRDEQGYLQGARVAIGKGSVTFIDGVPFGNKALMSDGAAADDEGLLLVEALQLRRGDVLWFLSDAQGPTLLSLMWRTGWPAIVLGLGLLLLALWRGAPRFGPLEAPASTARRSLAEQIRGTGQFTLRVGGGRALQAAAARALADAARTRIRGYGNLDPAAQAAAVARLTGVPEASLAQALVPDTPARRRDLYTRMLALESARRALLIPNKVITHAD
jgi:hypothetical protein